MHKYKAHIDGRLQVLAGTALLEKSRLVEWNASACEFFAVERDAFEAKWQKEIDPVFGRLLCWIVFSAGAEFLAKGVYLLRGMEIQSKGEVPAYPTGDFKNWAAKFRDDWRYFGTVPVTQFGSLGHLLHECSKGKSESHLSRLFAMTNAKPEETNLLISAYELLRQSIRKIT